MKLIKSVVSGWYLLQILVFVGLVVSRYRLEFRFRGLDITFSFMDVFFKTFQILFVFNFVESAIRIYLKISGEF